MFGCTKMNKHLALMKTLDQHKKFFLSWLLFAINPEDGFKKNLNLNVGL